MSKKDEIRIWESIPVSMPEISQNFSFNRLSDIHPSSSNSTGKLHKRVVSAHNLKDTKRETAMQLLVGGKPQMSHILNNNNKSHLTSPNKFNQNSFSSILKSPSTNYTLSQNLSIGKIAFGKTITNKIEPSIFFKTSLLNKKKPNKKIKHPEKIKKQTELSQQMRNLYKKGITSKEIEKIKNNGIDIDNQENCFSDNTFYPIITQKRMVKNILPKEYDFKKIKSPEEVLSNAYRPLVRYQKKILTKHINNINQEINVNYSNWFSLVKKHKFSEKFRMCQDLIDLEKDAKLIGMISQLINRNFKLGNEINEVIENRRKQEEYEHRQQLLRRFKEVIIRAAIHFKRLNISLEDLYSIDHKQIVPFEKQGSYYLICAIKDNDVDNIYKIIRDDPYLVYDFDHFKQTPLHWAAKRNVYQVLSLFISKGANVSAQDQLGRTPLHVAAEFNHLDSVQILLYDLANPLLKDKRGKIAFDLTTNDVIKYILQRAATVSIFI